MCVLGTKNNKKGIHKREEGFHTGRIEKTGSTILISTSIIYSLYRFFTILLYRKTPIYVNFFTIRFKNYTKNHLTVNDMAFCMYEWCVCVCSCLFLKNYKKNGDTLVF